MSVEAVHNLMGLFDVEIEGRTVIVTPVADLRETDFQAIESGAEEVLALLSGVPARNVVVDLRGTDYYGSTALGFFVRLWKRVRSRNGRMAFCNVSEHEREILRVMRLDGLWPVCSSRDEALAAVEV
jgi:anti-anti-sigma factor